MKTSLIAIIAAGIIVLIVGIVLIVLDNGNTLLIPTGDGGIVPVPMSK